MNNGMVHVRLTVPENLPKIEEAETFADWIRRTGGAIGESVTWQSSDSEKQVWAGDPKFRKGMSGFFDPAQEWVSVDISPIRRMWSEKAQEGDTALDSDIQIADTLPTRLPYPAMVFEHRELSFLKMQDPDSEDGRLSLIGFDRMALFLMEYSPDIIWEGDGKSVSVIGVLMGSMGSVGSVDGIRPGTVVVLGIVAMPPWASISNTISVAEKWMINLENELIRWDAQHRRLLWAEEHIAIASVVFLFAMRMLHAKNVDLEVEAAPKMTRQQRRLLERRGIRVGERHKIVVKVPGSKQTVTIGSHWNAGERQQHMVRGHFSTYTEEKPLFGKHTGTYWIPAHIRGTKGSLGTPEYVEAPNKIGT